MIPLPIPVPTTAAPSVAAPRAFIWLGGIAAEVGSPAAVLSPPAAFWRTGPITQLKPKKPRRTRRCD